MTGRAGPDGTPHAKAPTETPTVLVVPTGVANLASVTAAFARLGVATRVAASPDEVAEAPGVVLPGVGSFGSARTALRESGMDVAVAERVRGRTPTLAICLGMQLLCEGSTEADGEAGLGVVPGLIHRFEDTRWVPQLGWNAVTPTSGDGLVRPGHAYFAHSYRLSEAPAEWAISWSESGDPFVAAFEDRGVLACQFHPELSGAWGRDLLRRWVVRAGVLPC